mmetsp:Transcript_9158/g.10467  ORF Transcript_9158/g.10467 Transcript_9158/m.10467 type:complete len:88 (+) Transcript_9158:428-691(+)
MGDLTSATIKPLLIQSQVVQRNADAVKTVRGKCLSAAVEAFAVLIEDFTRLDVSVMMDIKAIVVMRQLCPPLSPAPTTAAAVGEREH